MKPFTHTVAPVHTILQSSNIQITNALYYVGYRLTNKFRRYLQCKSNLKSFLSSLDKPILEQLVKELK